MDDEKDESVETAENGENTEGGAGAQSNISSDLIRGHINTIILRTLSERDKYGYEIIEEIEAKSHNQYTLKQPTLYSALKRLESQGLVSAYWKTDEASQGGRRKYYTISEAGRQIVEKNMSEWEYSRTVIDSLISDRNFDFSQPAPTVVDFKILKDSTSRVTTAKEEKEEKEEIAEVKTEPVREVKYEEPTPPPAPQIVVEPAPQQPVQPIVQQVVEQPVAQQPVIQVIEQPAPQQPVQQVIQPAPQAQPVNDEQRRILHENYLKLITPTERVQTGSTVPEFEKINTDKLIYNNRPAPERDYKNLLNNLYSKTLTASPAAPADEPQIEPAANYSAHTVRYEDASSMAKNDGLNASEYVVSGSRIRKFNRGSTLFICSIIVAALMFVEFAVCLALKNDLKISLGYPFLILAFAIAEVLIFFILRYTDFGKSKKKPSSLTYLTASIIVSVILIAIIFLVSFIIEVDYSSGWDIAAKIIIPCLVTLNIPIFSGTFFLLTR